MGGEFRSAEFRDLRSTNLDDHDGEWQTRAVSSTSIVSALLDPVRLMVAGSLAGTVRTTAEVADYTGADHREVIAAIAALRQVGLVEPVGDGYTLPPAGLRRLAAELAERDVPMDPWVGFGMTDDERLVLERFFQGRTLVEVPTNRAKRLLVLERISLEFDLGQRYSEAAVDDLLHGFHPDVATLRRHLVDEGLLDRGGGQYWRSGGRTALPPEPLA